ncbi:MAG: hypothetical protein SF097_02605 [Acidobacteriota bacterium]|nr:hypothetical protein [Acidobacteriota bacterium]
MKTFMNKLRRYQLLAICVLVAVGFALAIEPQKAAALIKKHNTAFADTKVTGQLYNMVNAGSVTGTDWRAAVEAQNKPGKSAGKGGTAVSPNNPSAVLYNQTDNGSGNGAPDQDFEAAFDSYDSEGADDFVVPANRVWTVQSVYQVSTTGSGANQTADVTFYSNNAGVPGGVVCQRNGSAAVVTAGDTTTTLGGGGCVLPAGTYWVGVQVNQNFGTFGQHFWSNRSTQTGNESVWRNPGDGFATGCTNFDRQTTCGVGGGQSPDFLFRLDGLDNPTTSPIGPGIPYPAQAELSDQKAGSVLIYNVYTSGATSGNAQNTRINITNTHPQRDAWVHLFFVAESCAIADSYICLTANQTASFLASDLDPGTTGYLVAVAVDGRLGCPTNFNFLIGDEYVKFASGHAANLGAEAIAALYEGNVAGCDGGAFTAVLAFDGNTQYNRVPAALALDNVGSRADGNDTLVIINRIAGNLGIGAATLGTLFGILYDDAENALSFSVTGGCQLRNSITNNFPRTTPRFETFIPAGRTGWAKVFNQTGAIGMTGAAINFNANAASSAGAFNNGHNLHHLTLNAASGYIIPVFPPSC